MKKNIFSIIAITLCLWACTDDDSGESYLGKPVDLNICMEGTVQTRVATAMTTGSVYLKSNIEGATWKRYTWDSDNSKYTSENQLMWTAPTMIITGYYINDGSARPADDLSYTVTSTTQSYLVGQTTATYGSTENVNITLKQQLAKIKVTVESKDGSTLSNPRLGGDVLYTTGVFDNSSFNDGYSNGGSTGTGWTVSPNGLPSTVDMIQETSTGSSVTYSAIILPQSISNTTVNFFVVTASNGGNLSHQVGYRLANATTFVAGRLYELKVDAVTNTLYLESDVIVDDFSEPDTGDKIDNTYPL